MARQQFIQTLNESTVTRGLGKFCQVAQPSTRDVSRVKVLAARSIMTDLSGADFAGEVAAETKIAEVAAAVEAADRPFAVIENGRPVGELTRDAVVSVLVGRDALDGQGGR